MKKSNELTVVQSNVLAKMQPTSHVINGAIFDVIAQVSMPILSQKDMPFDQPFNVQFLSAPYESEVESDNGGKTKYILAKVYNLDEGQAQRIWMADMLLADLDEHAPDPSLGRLFRASAITARICATEAGNTDGQSYAPAYVGRCFRITRKRQQKSAKGFNFNVYDIAELGNAPQQESLAV